MTPVKERNGGSSIVFSSVSFPAFPFSVLTVVSSCRTEGVRTRPAESEACLYNALCKGHIRSVAIQIQPVKTATLKLGRAQPDSRYNGWGRYR